MTLEVLRHRVIITYEAEVEPQDVARGGSRLGNAIQVAADSFLNKTTDHKAIVLFTDGEDMESDPIKEAQLVHKERGVCIFTVGLGDTAQGERIPVSTSRGSKSYLEYNGQQVWSKMNGQVLRQIATDTDGAYIAVGTKRVDMASVCRTYCSNAAATGSISAPPMVRVVGFMVRM